MTSKWRIQNMIIVCFFREEFHQMLFIFGDTDSTSSEKFAPCIRWKSNTFKTELLVLFRVTSLSLDPSCFGCIWTELYCPKRRGGDYDANSKAFPGRG